MKSANPKKVVGAAVVLLGLSTAGYYGYRHYFHDASHDPFYGSVDLRNVSVGFRVGGRVTEVLVDEGAAVAAGQVLARLDAEPYRRARDEALAARDAAAARMNLLQRGYRPEEIARSAAQLDEARAALTNAEKTDVRTNSLRDMGASSQSAADDAHAARVQAEARVRAVEHEYRQLRAGYRSEEVAEARANLAKAEAAYSRAELQFEDTELKAPEAGTVQTRAIEPGSLVDAGGASLMIAKTAEAWVRAYVPETSLGRTVPGAAVAVYTDSRQQPYQGRIGSVSPRAEFTPRNVETTDLRTSLVYRVRVLIDQPDAAIRQGMPVTLHLVAAAK